LEVRRNLFNYKNVYLVPGDPKVVPRKERWKGRNTSNSRYDLMYIAMGILLMTLSPHNGKVMRCVVYNNEFAHQVDAHHADAEACGRCCIRSCRRIQNI
jgi:hypothetical protein